MRELLSIIEATTRTRGSWRRGPAEWVLAVALGASLAPPAAKAETASNAAEAAGPVGANGNGVSLEEVTVTARKREERLIDVPVVASVLGAAQLQRYNTTDLEQLSQQIPGVEIYHADGGGGGGGISIRGVGQLATDYGAEEPVAIVVDGMAFTRGHILDTGFFDMQSVEVLKGPQSLFFGKNSPAGAINITSNNPDSEFGGYLRASYEFTTEDPVVEGAVSLPVSDKLAFRFAIHAEDMQGGWLTNDARPILNNPLPGEAGQPIPGPAYNKYPMTKELLGRMTVVWKPTDRFTVTLKAYGSVRHDDDGAPVSLGACGAGVGGHPYFDGYPDPTQTCTGKLHWTIDEALPPAPLYDTLAGVAPGESYFMNSVNYIYTLNLNYRFDKFDITSITGVWDHREREFTNFSYDSYGGVASKQGESGVQYTQELRVHSDLEFPVNFTLGAYMEKDQYDHGAPIDLLPLGPYTLPGPYYGTYMTWNNIDENSNQSYSFFGQVNWKILPNLELAGGARWSHEDRSALVGNAFNAFDALVAEGYLPEADNPFSPAGLYYHPKLSYQNVSPEATLTWHPQTNLTVYAAYKTGYLAAGIANPGSVPNLTTFPSAAEQDKQLIFGGETVRGFEGGVKGAFLGGRLSGDIDAFRYTYSNLQVAVFNPQTISFSTQNAAGAVSEGVEGQAAFQVTPEFTIRGSFSYAYLQYTSYANAECYPGQTATQGCVSGVIGGVATTFQNQSGHPYGDGPAQGIFGFNYDKELNAKWSVLLTSDIQITSRGYDILGQPGTATPAHTILDASLKLYQRDHTWEVAVIGTNLTDAIYADPYGDKPLGNVGDLDTYLHPPREVTLQVTRRF
jgi:outer membrane receptor protein involved in Fe transport